MKKLSLLLILPILLAMTSCTPWGENNGEEIDANHAEQLLTSIKNYKYTTTDYTRVLTSHSEIIEDEEKTEIEVYNKIEKENTTVHEYYKNINNGNEKETDTYIYEKKEEYYQNDQKIEKGLYNTIFGKYEKSSLSTSYILLVGIYIPSSSNPIEYGKSTMYSKGEGNLTLIYEIDMKSVDGTYYSKITYKYDDYKFVYYELESEENKFNGDIEKQHRTESIKYKAKIRNPYK